MPMYERSPSTGIEVIDKWDDGFGWLAHPDEDAQRASHAIRGDDGVWVFDPLDGPGVDERLADLGNVAGIAVQSNFHARDAGALAERHGVSVHVAGWMDRVADQIDAPTERYAAPPGKWVDLAESGIEVRTVDPATAWKELIAFRPSDCTLRVPDMLSNASAIEVVDERLNPYLFHRLAPPREPFADVDPNRVLVGHGRGVAEDAADALESALENARRNLPRALVQQAPQQVRGIIGALRG